VLAAIARLRMTESLRSKMRPAAGAMEHLDCPYRGTFASRRYVPERAERGTNETSDTGLAPAHLASGFLLGWTGVKPPIARCQIGKYVRNIGILPACLSADSRDFAEGRDDESNAG
jgi:hypothetical protein